MINLSSLTPILTGYKSHFLTHWENDEDYKWKAVAHFQKHWNIDAPNFGEMFMQATGKTINLLASGYAYPRRMIQNFAQKEDDTVREMFRDLYEEEKPLETRIRDFQAAAEAIRAKYDDGHWRSHYQNTNAISTYLWLRYPDRYYVYKYELVRAAALELSSDFVPKGNGSAADMLGGYRLYDEIRAAIRNDAEICAMIRDALAVRPSCYADPEMRTATIDVAFYLKRYYLQEKKEWFPQDYDPDLPVDSWAALLEDETVFDRKSLQIMKRMKDYGGQATCTQLAEKYGESKNFYSSGSVSLARRVVEATGCPVYTAEDESVRYWPVLYVGKKAGKEEAGSYVWRLRDELSQALDQVDLSGIELYAAEESGEVSTPEPEIPKYTKADFLGTVYMDGSRYDVLEALLWNKKNIILQGAPGVGKTFAAKRLAYAMMGERDDSRIETVQFHQNYSYEDFVMGYRPDGAGFKLTEGVFYRFCQKAAACPEKDHFFIIDEINRGNLSRIFGELLMLIEKDYRGTKVTLPYCSEPFSVPERLYIIGMMNTADRSLAMIDYALRRRFGFFGMEPAFDSDGFKKYQESLANESFDKLIAKIGKLNEVIREDPSLGPGFRIGHSYFCGWEKAECTPERMRAVVEFDILPMLEEYWFDDRKTYQHWCKELWSAVDGEG